MYRILIIISLLTIYTFSNAQPIRGYRVKDRVEAAEKAIAEGNYYQALDQYEEAYKQQKDPEFAYKIALLNLTLRDYVKTETQLSRILATTVKGSKPPAEAYYYLGQALKMNGKTKEATDAFTQYIAEGKDQNLITLAQNELDGIKAIPNLPLNKDISVVNAGTLINTPFTESNAVLHDSTLYLISFQRKTPIVLDGKDNQYHAKIYTSVRGKDGKWAKPVALPDAINRPNNNESHVTLSPDGNTMVFTRSLLINNEVAETRMFVSKKENNAWTPAREVKLPNSNNADSTFQIRYPAFGKMFDKDVLFVSSNMNGGKGGYDLYYGNFDGETLGDLTNIVQYNTPGDEISPFYTKTKFYFSSNGRPGMGGFDIYSSDWSGTNFGEAVNMGRQYNTSYDDMYFSMNADNTTGFLVSNRPGTRSLKSKTCCDDIFFFSLKPIIVDLAVHVFETPKRPLKGAKVIINEFVEQSKFEKERKSNDQSNDFAFNLDVDKAYQVIVTKDNYSADTFELNTVGILESTTVQKDIILKTKRSNNNGNNPSNINTKPESEIISINEPIRLNNIYYEYDDAAILKDAEQDLSVLLDLMKEYPTMVIELSSHTDSRGNDDYNKRLSQRRANSAKNWLVARGVDPSRIKAIGYGETKILNRCKNGVNCTDEEHQFNRRTEFKILEGPTSITIKKEIFKSKTPDANKGGANVLPKSTNKKKGVPVLEWDNPFHDFGNVSKGDTEVHDFKFTNVGDADLIIEIATACDCTDLDYPQNTPIKPGGKGTLKATFHSKEKDGETEITINVIANTDPIVAESRFRAFVK